MTVDEFNELTDGPPYYELVNGLLFEMPLPELFSSSGCWKCCAVLSRYLDAFPVGELLFGPCGVVFDRFRCVSTRCIVRIKQSVRNPQSTWRRGRARSRCRSFFAVKCAS